MARKNCFLAALRVLILASPLVTHRALAQSVNSAAVYYAPTFNEGGHAAKTSFIAQHYQLVVGGAEIGADIQAMKSANPNLKFCTYNSATDNYVPSSEDGALTQKAQSYGIDPEVAYMHYWDDTVINLNGSSISIPGYGGGSATNPADARVVVYYPDKSRRAPTFDTANARRLHKEVMADLAFKTPVPGTSVYADCIFLDNSSVVLYNTGTIVSGGHIREMPAHDLIGSAAFQSWFWNNFKSYLAELKSYLHTAPFSWPDGKPKESMINIANSWSDTIVSANTADYLFMEFEYDPIRDNGMDAITEAARRDNLAAAAGIKSFYAPLMTSSANGSSISAPQAKLGALAWYLTTRSTNSQLFLFGNMPEASESAYPAASWTSYHWPAFMDPVNQQLGNPVGQPYLITQGTDSEGHSYKVWGRDYTNGLSAVRGRGDWNQAPSAGSAVTVTLPRSLRPVGSDGSIGSATTQFNFVNGQGSVFLSSSGSPTPTPTRTPTSDSVAPAAPGGLRVQ